MPDGFEAALAAAPPVDLYSKQLRFAIDLRQDIINEAHLEGAEMPRAEAFTARMIQELTEVGELDDGQVAFHRAKGMEVSGYSVADDGHTLDLIISIFTKAIPLVPLDTQAIPPETVTRDQVETGFSCLLGFRRPGKRYPFRVVSKKAPLRLIWQLLSGTFHK